MAWAVRAAAATFACAAATLPGYDALFTLPPPSGTGASQPAQGARSTCVYVAELLVPDAAVQSCGGAGACPTGSVSLLWPPHAVTIDVDIVAGGRAGEPDRASVSVSYLLPAEGVDVDSGQSAVEASRQRPGDTARVCALLLALLPWLQLGPCSPHRATGLNLYEAGPLDPSAVSREGALLAGAFVGEEEEGGARHLPFELPALQPGQGHAARSALDWGAGLVALASSSNRSVLHAVHSVSGDTVPQGSPLSRVQGGGDTPTPLLPGLFFAGHTSRGNFSGPVAALLRERWNAWTAAGLSAGGAGGEGGAWVSTRLHLTLARSPHARTVALAVAEAAELLAPALVVPEAGSLLQTGGVLHSDVFLGGGLLGVACERHSLEGGGRRSGEPLGLGSTYVAAVRQACEEHAAAEGQRKPTDAVAAWLGAALGRLSGEPPPATPVWAGQVCTDFTGRGFHHDVEYTVTASALLPPSSSSRLHPSCRVALHLHLPAGVYVDLDEVRTAVRDASAEDRARGGERTGRAPLSFRSFCRFIDVERPAYRSTQHVVLLRHDAAVRSGGAHGDGHNNLSALRHGGAVATVVRGGGGGGDTLHLSARFRTALHKRYPAPGCASGGEEALPASSLSTHATACTKEWGATVYRDGSVWVPALPGGWRAAARTAWARVTGWGSSPGQAGGGETQDVPSLDDACSDARPFFPGCYVLVHAPRPTVHVECTGVGGGETGHRPATWRTVSLLPPLATAQGLPCRPPRLLPPMPTGHADHAVWAVRATAAFYLLASLAVVACALRASAGEGGGALSAPLAAVLKALGERRARFLYDVAVEAAAQAAGLRPSASGPPPRALLARRVEGEGVEEGTGVRAASTVNSAVDSAPLAPSPSPARRRRGSATPATQR